MKSNIFKKGASLLMSAVMCLSTFMGVGSMTAFAAAEQSEVYIVGFPRDGDANYSADWGHPNLNYMNGWTAGSSRYTNIRAIGSYDGNVCYCIEPGVPQDTGDTFTAWDENFWENYPDTYNKTITGPEIKDHIGRILQYGYRGQISTAWRSQNEGADKLAHVVATQLLIWETVVGERDSDFSKVSTGGHDAVLDSISSNHPLRDRIMSYYNSIESSVLNHTTIPSFFSAGKGSAPQVEIYDNVRKQQPFPEAEKEAAARLRKEMRSHPAMKCRGLRSLYFRYCYELHIIVKHSASVKRVSFLLREDVSRMDRYIAQTRLLGREQIETGEQLVSFQSSLEEKMKALARQRTELRNKLKIATRNGNSEEVGLLKKQIAEITAEIKAARKEVILCKDIAERSGQVAANLEQIDHEIERKETKHDEHIRRSSRPGREDDSKRS